MDASQIQRTQIFEEWFDRKKSHGCGRLSKCLNPRKPVLPVFNSDTPPNMCKVSKSRQVGAEQFAHPLSAFSQHLVRVPVCQLHDNAGMSHVRVGNLLMEKI
jgi:hypothetical protein